MRISSHLCRTLILLFALTFPVGLLVPGGLQGQTNISVQAGASLATLAGSDVASADSRAGIRVGASTLLPLRPNLDLQLGAAYAAKGATEREFDVDVEFAMNWLEIPLLLRFTPSIEGSLSPHFLIGPALALRVGCSATAGTEGFELSVDCDDEEFGDEIKTMDFGAVAGAGLDIPTSGSLTVSLDVLYNLGLSSISETTDVKNRAFSVLAGITFPIG